MGKEIQRVIVDRALQRGGFSSYSELAVRLGVSAPTLSQWRQGINPIPERRLEQLCKLSGDDVGVFRLAIMAEETKITSLRKSIQAVLKDAGRTIPTTALALLVALGANIGTSTNASANSHNGHNNVSQQTPTIDIMRN